MRRPCGALLLPMLLALLLSLPTRAWAGPVSWKEVPPTAEGRQWWDEGSLRRNRSGHLTVLSRFQAAPALEAGAVEPGVPAGPAGSPDTASDELPLAAPLPAPAGSLPAGLDQRPQDAGRSVPTVSRLYVMELDCDQSLYRDISINGLPQFNAAWQPTGSDDLTAEVLRQACAAEAA